MTNQTDPTAQRLRSEPTKMERLEEPAPLPMAPLPVEAKPPVSESVEENIHRREEAIRRPGPGR